MAHEPQRGPEQQPKASLMDRLNGLRVATTEAVESAAERIPVIGTVVQAAERERSAGGVLLAGGVAYRLFFWLVPLGLVGATVASFFTASTARGLETAAEKSGLGGVAAQAAQRAITSGEHGGWYLLGIGSIFVIWFGYGVVRALLIVYALAWGETPRKVKNPVRAGAAFTVIASALTIAAAAIGNGAARIGLGPIAPTLATVLAYTGAALGISVLFPHGDAPPRALLPGAFLGSAGGLILHATVSVYFAPKLGRSVDMYGLLGASTVILLWLYLIARLITLSAFLNATLWMRGERPATPEALTDVHLDG
jgi:uncharacterized BrkB/YihY/UPF0761 family membrane protein